MMLSIVTLISCSSDHDPAMSVNGGSDSPQVFSTCMNRIKGSWGFGLTPYGCAMPTKATQNANAKYLDFTTKISDKKNKSEQKRYAQLMYDFLLKTSEDYLLRREPDVSDREMSAWIHLVLVTNHQESYWTHYRMGEDNDIRFLRGDNNHGYGMMQIDDRWHKEFIKSQGVFDLKEHITYALDLLYSIRVKVQKKPCYKGLGFKNQNRSIYSAYNGGIKSKCRWRNSKSKWRRNDAGFLKKYDQKIWEKHVQSRHLIEEEPVVVKENETPKEKEIESVEESELGAEKESVEEVIGSKEVEEDKKQVDESQGVDKVTGGDIDVLEGEESEE